MCTHWTHREREGQKNCNERELKNNNLLAFHDVIKIIVLHRERRESVKSATLATTCSVILMEFFIQ